MSIHIEPAHTINVSYTLSNKNKATSFAKLIALNLALGDRN